MKKLKALIADDEPMAREIIASYLKDFEQVGQVREAVNGIETIQKVNSELPDLLFLDIQMPKMDGIAVLDSHQLKVQPVTIFTTAYDEYALKAFELNAIDYLMKPFDRARFHQTMNKALERLKLIHLNDLQIEWSKFRLDYENVTLEKNASNFPTKLVVKDSKRIKHIQVDDIVTIQASGDYVEINEPAGKFLLYKSISDLLTKLDPQIFRRIHKSVIINTEKISEIRPHTNGEYFFHLTDGSRFKSGRTFKEAVSDLVSGNV